MEIRFQEERVFRAGERRLQRERRALVGGVDAEHKGAHRLALLERRVLGLIGVVVQILCKMRKR